MGQNGLGLRKVGISDDVSRLEPGQSSVGIRPPGDVDLAVCRDGKRLRREASRAETVEILTNGSEFETGHPLHLGGRRMQRGTEIAAEGDFAGGDVVVARHFPPVEPVAVRGEDVDEFDAFVAVRAFVETAVEAAFDGEEGRSIRRRSRAYIDTGENRAAGPE